MAEIVLTEKGAKVLGILKDKNVETADQAILAKDIADADFHMSVTSVPGILTGLCKKGLVDKTEDSPRKYFLTEDGKNFSL